MNKIKDLYHDNLIYIFTKKQLRHQDATFLIIIKDDCPIVPLDNCITMHYQDDFESLLNFSLPTKNRRTKQLISLPQCYEILAKINYGVLSFCHDGLPYSVGLNHIIVNDRIFFHCAKNGFKLNSINQRAAFLVIEDLGINPAASTHNHYSVAITGTIREITDINTKKTALLKIISDHAPAYPYNDTMVENTNIIELEVDYIIGKSHIR